MNYVTNNKNDMKLTVTATQTMFTANKILIHHFHKLLEVRFSKCVAFQISNKTERVSMYVLLITFIYFIEATMKSQ